jgi:hypothetical protein
VEDSLRLAERDGDRRERATNGDEPSGARIASTQASDDSDADSSDEREPQQPSGLATEAVVDEAQWPACAAERTTMAAGSETAGPSGLAEQPP